jgi:UDP-2,3-diacylglucosamine pyrophosphatase LpxH
VKYKKKDLEVLVISDVHLGTYGCHAKELSQYLKSVNPKTIILNGDIIDIWQFSKQYWPKSHMKVIKQIMRWAGKGVKIYYVTGNHDEMLRKFVGFKMGSVKIVNKVILNLSTGKKAWFFHDDVFDITMQHSKWLAKLGAVGYDTLIHINSFANFISEKLLHRGKISLSKRIKNSVKGAVKFINNFEQIAADIGISNKYDYVVCGHIHQPAMKEIKNDDGVITYLNSGDWVENLTALEYAYGQWTIYQYDEKEYKEYDEDDEIELDDSQLFNELVEEFNLLKQ